MLSGLTVTGFPKTHYLAWHVDSVVAAIPGTGVVYTVSSAIGGGPAARFDRGLMMNARHRAAHPGCHARAVRDHAGRGARFRGRQVGWRSLPCVHGYLHDSGRRVADGFLLRVSAAVPRRAFQPVRRAVGVARGRFMPATFIVFAVYAWVSAVARDRVFDSPNVRRWLQRTPGVILIGLAARLTVTGR